MPLLSVVIPTRNRAGRLRGAIDSVLAQTMDDLEIIVIDDGSTDATPEVVAAAGAQDPRVRSLRLPSPSGASAARNHGIRATQGEFLAFLDDDDRWLPRKAEVQIAYLRENPSTGAVSSHYLVVDERVRSRRPVAFRGPTAYPPEALLWANFPRGGGSLAMIRRSSYSGDILFDETLPGCQDWDLWVSCSKEAVVVTVPEVLCQITFHGPSQISSPERMSAATEVFVAKHAASMSNRCRAFHDARLQLLRAPSARQRLGLHARLLRTLPPDVRGPIFLVMLSSRVGGLLRDPGLGLRVLLLQIGNHT